MKTSIRFYEGHPIAYRVEMNRRSDDVFETFVTYWNPLAPERGAKTMKDDAFFELTAAERPALAQAA